MQWKIHALVRIGKHLFFYLFSFKKIYFYLCLGVGVYTWVCMPLKNQKGSGPLEME